MVFKSENDPKINVRHKQTSDPGSSENTKQNKYPNDTQAYNLQTTESQR